MNVTTSVPEVELEELDELEELLELDELVELEEPDELEELLELDELVELEVLDELDDPELAGSAPFPHAAMSIAPADNAVAKATRLNMVQPPWSDCISPGCSIADRGRPVHESAKRDSFRGPYSAIHGVGARDHTSPPRA